MSLTGQTKICPACAEAIQAAAKVCPHCRTKQVRFALWRQEAGGLFLASILAVAFIVTAAWIAPDDEVNGRSFERHEADLSVKNLMLEKGVHAEEFHLAGVVTNTGTYPWRVREIEVHFLAQSGDMIDVQHPKLHEPFVIQPRGEGAFSVSLWHLHPGASLARLEARVQSATDGNKPPDPD